MKSISYGLLVLPLFLVGLRASAQKYRPISANGQPLTFQVVRATFTQDPQSFEQAEAVLTGINLQAASSQRGYTYNGPINEIYNYHPIPLLSSESFLIVEFNLLNVRRKLQLSTADIKLIDGTGSVHQTLGSPGHRENSWFPFDSEGLDPKNKNNGDKWVFKVPTAAVSAAVIQFQNATYPLSPEHTESVVHTEAAVAAQDMVIQKPADLPVTDYWVTHHGAVPDYWVSHKGDNRISVKFPSEPTESTPGTFTAVGKDSVAYIFTIVDFVQAANIDSVALAPMKTTPEFAAQLKTGINQSLPDVTFPDFAIGTWKGFTCYTSSGTDSKKRQYDMFMFIIGNKLYSVSTVSGANSGTKGHDDFVNSIMLSN